MALGPSTFQNLGGAVSDIFASKAASTNANLKAAGLRIQGQSTRLGAQGLRIKAQGDIAEAENYDLAGALALKNKAYTAESTAIQQMQLDRSIGLTIGGQRAGTAGAGLKSSGSALDLLADSASQGALAKSVLAKQGEITEAGYEEQAASFSTMSRAARMAYSGEMSLADQTDQVAMQEDKLADQTIAAGEEAKKGDFWAAAIKGASAAASLYMGNPLPAVGRLASLFSGGGGGE
jgi:hypothetical protein